VRVWLSVPWLALAGAQLARDIRWGLILRAVLLFGRAGSQIFMFAAMSNTIVIFQQIVNDSRKSIESS